MNSEKVKEIKKALECCSVRSGNCDKCPFIKEGFDCDLYLVMDALKLINELESENERLILQYERVKADSEMNCLELKDRIAELEEALLDMVVQFCQMGKEGYLHHTFMSAEENAFDVLDIEYGEKVDDVYKRFNERWGKKNER